MLLYYYNNILFQSPLRNTILLLIFLAFVTLMGIVLTRIRTDSQKINWIVLGTMIGLFMIVATVWILNVPNNQISDFGNFWTRVPGFLVGDKLYETDNDYFSKYAYQTGFMIYVTSVVRIFGYKIFAIQFLNVIYQGLILLFKMEHCYRILFPFAHRRYLKEYLCYLMKIAFFLAFLRLREMTFYII